MTRSKILNSALNLEAQLALVVNIRTVYGEAGITWLEQLPALLAQLSDEWNFSFIRPITNLSYNFVAWVKLNEKGEVVVLKTAPPKGSIMPEAIWLKSFTKAVPRIIRVSEEHNAFIMERLVPGETLKSLVRIGQDELATRIICQTILDLHSEPLNISSFKHVSELTVALPLLKGHISNYLLSKIISLFHDLAMDRTHDVLLHGDLHHDNILQNDSSWKVIDPHGYIGDPAAETGAMIYNPLDSFPTERSLKQIMDARLKILYEMLPYDAQRIKAWILCWTALSAAWDIEGEDKIHSNKAEILTLIDAIKP